MRNLLKITLTLVICWICLVQTAAAQDPSQAPATQTPSDGAPTKQDAKTDSTVGSGDMQQILLPNALGPAIGLGPAIIFNPLAPRPLAFLYASKSRAAIEVSSKAIEQTINVEIRVVQGKGETISFGLAGSGEVLNVEGEGVLSWAIRTLGIERFLDIVIKPDGQDKKATVKLRTNIDRLPAQVDLAHLTPGVSLGFDSQLEIQFANSLSGKVIEASGFAPLVSSGKLTRLQTSSGGRLTLRLDRQSALPPVVELVDAALTGKLDQGGKSMSFSLTTTAVVQESGAKIRGLSGSVALSKLPESADYRIALVTTDSGPAYEITFAKAGRFALALDFVAPVKTTNGAVNSVDFSVAGGAVVPIRLEGFDKQIDFEADNLAVVPMQVDNQWQGFLPASGNVSLRWKSSQESGDEGKSFFTTTSLIETSVGPGLMRQEHRITYKMLQGQMRDLAIAIRGPGEIVSVEGNHIVAWKVVAEGEARRLEVTLSQPIANTSQLIVRSQTVLSDFPVRAEAMTLQPQSAIRNSGHVRISSSASVRIEPTAIRGLSQLAADQYPAQSIQARQVFAYRFPADDFGYTIIASQIQPEISVTHSVLYQLSESDRLIAAQIELDIREAAIRQFNLLIPEDYSVVSASGSAVGDFLVASEVNSGSRNLRFLFTQEVQGRQLVSLRLEKNQPAAAGSWELPTILFPDAKTVRGDVGVAAAAGLRTSVSKSDLLIEKPLAYFPVATPNLQQAYRLREPTWTATVQIEQIERSVQSDVFHLYSLSQGVVYGSALINYSVTGSPVAEWKLQVPTTLSNVTVDGPEIRSWRREGDVLIVSLHRPVLGTYTLLLTFEEKPKADGVFQAALVSPLEVQGDRGFIQVVSPVLVELQPQLVSPQLLVLDPLELPAELRLLSSAPSLGTWQYTQRPFDLRLKVTWFDPGATASQVVEFSEANSRVSQDGELVTDMLYYVKTRGQKVLKLRLPEEPVRLWSAFVAGRPVTARKAGDETLIPLPGEADPNEPVEVRLRLGKSSSSKSSATLELPIVFAPVLKTQWNVSSDENHVLIASGGTVQPARPTRWPNGFDRLATRGLVPLVALAVFGIVGLIIQGKAMKLALMLGAVVIALWGAGDAWDNVFRREPLQLSLPVTASGESVVLKVDSIPAWRAFVSWPGIGLVLIGIALIGLFIRNKPNHFAFTAALLLVACGILLQSNGLLGFWCLVVLVIMLLQVFPLISQIYRNWKAKVEEEKSKLAQAVAENSTTEPNGGGSVVTSTIILLATMLLGSTASLPRASADEILLGKTRNEAERQSPDDIESIRAADSLVQKWQVSSRDGRLTATATMTLTAKAGDRIILLCAPAVLTKFQGEGLRLAKSEVANGATRYFVTIASDSAIEANPPAANDEPKSYSVTFEYQLDAIQPGEGIPVLTGSAAYHNIELTYDEPSLEVTCDSAARIEVVKPVGGNNQGAKPETNSQASAKILLNPSTAKIFLRPQTRDLSAEAVRFYVEGAGVYIPGPGVIDGKHRFKVRTAQGRLQNLSILIPKGLTVSAVDGPVTIWKFDAENGRLKVEIDRQAPTEFSLTVETQRSLGNLPTQVELLPLRIEAALNDVGLIAIAFGSEAQPENIQADGFSPVGPTDFDASLLAGIQATLHRVFRYGNAGKLKLQVSPVAPEIRVITKQVISLSDERVVLAANLITEITRTGVFQLSFPLPAGLEVESLSGESLHHWSEVEQDGKRQIVLHLVGKTIGVQKFSLTLAGPAPAGVSAGAESSQWELPKLNINEANRQTGELVVQPMTGLRLRATNRQNCSEADPRGLGSQTQGAIAFRLLQQDWSVQLFVERLAPWITGSVLHDVTLREGQTRSRASAQLNVQNAAIRSLQIKLPITSAEIIKTLRATGDVVSDLVRTTEDGNIWELRFKRRVVGPVQFQIEFERRGDRVGDQETLSPIELTEVQQLNYYFAVRSGGRLEIEAGNLPQGWQPSDWNSIPEALRSSGNRNSPTLTLRVNNPGSPLTLRAVRQSLAEALKLRVASGTLTTVLSQTGDQITSVDVTMDVIQRSSLSLQLPKVAELLSILVNGESVHSVRQKGTDQVWQFYVLPGIDDQTAQVRFAYSLKGQGLNSLSLASPLLNVPLENITWNVIVPKGTELIDNDGSLELVSQKDCENYDRNSYLSQLRGRRIDQANQATKLLQQANQLIQQGQRSKAQWALNSVANRYALDAASNEDARVQLESLQRQQAVVGLNTRRQRLLLDKGRSDTTDENEQKLQAAAANPILLQEQLDYRPQELSRLLAGNTREDNDVLIQLAGRLVQHQRTTEPAPQAIVFELPEEGRMYAFRRAVQVSGNAPLNLKLQFHSEYKLRLWHWVKLAVLLGVVGLSLYRRP